MPRMQAAPREVERLRREIPVIAFFFDLLFLDGYDLRRMPVEERKPVLAALLSGGPPALLYSDHVIGQGAAFYALAAESGVEGIVSKRLGSPYVGRRTTSWLKVKRVEDREFVIGGFTAPQGSRPHFGALLIGLYDDEGKLHYVTRVGSGFDDASLAALHGALVARKRQDPAFVDPPAIADARWTAPELVARVKFAEWTRDGGLRAPVFLGIAPDVAPGDCRLAAGDGEAPAASPAEEAAEAPPASRAEEAPHAPPAGEAGPSARTIRRSAIVDLTPRPGEVRLANPGKVLFPEDGITKRDIFEYFRLVAPVLLPHLEDRPLSLQRWPDGIQAPSFFQKDAPDVIPPYVRTEPIAGNDAKRPTRFIIAENEATLLWLANLTAFTLHPWGSRVRTLEHPDFMILDLDPKEAPFAVVVHLARALADLLREIGLRGYPKTTGSSGLHIYVPLVPEYTYDQVRGFAELLGHVLVTRRPEEATLELKVDERRGRVFVDYLRNQMGQTAAGPYVVRAIPGAPVSAPLTWDEVNAELTPRQFTIRNMADRLASAGDLWAPVQSDRQELAAPLAALAEILNR
jgi:bifunctional non-homologous end joining protein LigD